MDQIEILSEKIEFIQIPVTIRIKKIMEEYIVEARCEDQILRFHEEYYSCAVKTAERIRNCPEKFFGYKVITEVGK